MHNRTSVIWWLVLKCDLWVVCFVCFVAFTSQVNIYGHGWAVSSPNNSFPGQALASSLPVICAHTFACK